MSYCTECAFRIAKTIVYSTAVSAVGAGAGAAGAAACGINPVIGALFCSSMAKTSAGVFCVAEKYMQCCHEGGGALPRSLSCISSVFFGVYIGRAVVQSAGCHLSYRDAFRIAVSSSGLASSTVWAAALCYGTYIIGRHYCWLYLHKEPSVGVMDRENSYESGVIPSPDPVLQLQIRNYVDVEEPISPSLLISSSSTPIQPSRKGAEKRSEKVVLQTPIVEMQRRNYASLEESPSVFLAAPPPPPVATPRRNSIERKERDLGLPPLYPRNYKKKKARRASFTMSSTSVEKSQTVETHQHRSPLVQENGDPERNHSHKSGRAG